MIIGSTEGTAHRGQALSGRSQACLPSYPIPTRPHQVHVVSVSSRFVPAAVARMACSEVGMLTIPAPPEIVSEHSLWPAFLLSDQVSPITHLLF